MGSVTPSARKAVMERDGDCRAIGVLPDECHGRHDLHHVLPRHMGGGNRQKNLIRVCQRHHARIHHPDHEAEAVAAGLLKLGPIRRRKNKKLPPPTVPYRSTTLVDAMSGPYAPQTPSFVIPVGRSDKALHSHNGCVYPPYSPSKSGSPNG